MAFARKFDPLHAPFKGIKDTGTDMDLSAN